MAKPTTNGPPSRSWHAWNISIANRIHGPLAVTERQSIPAASCGTMGSMGCLEIDDFQRLENDKLDDADASRVRGHIDHCLTCRTAFEQFKLDMTGAPDEPRRLVDIGAAMGGSSEQSVLAADETIDTSNLAAAATSPSAPDLAKSFPRIEGYSISGVLGQGGMGIVYRAVQTKLNRAVALKVLPAMVGRANPATVKRFRREATAAARLHHTNIIPIYDFGESPEAYYYAMELITGHPLDDVVKCFSTQSTAQPTSHELNKLLGGMSTSISTSAAENKSKPDSASDPASPAPAKVGRHYFRQVARWICDAADGLGYAHDQGVIHRDIKPANLILSNDGRVMIADFGLAKTADEATMTMTGVLVGTLRYISPEQSRARGVPVDHRTDIFSLGATMYELLCFEPAFPQTEREQVLSAIMTRDPRSPRRVNPNIPLELDLICMKCLEKSPDARYENGKALADDLRRYVSDLPIVARRPSVARRVFKFVRRHRAAVAASTAILLLAASVLLWQRESTARRRAQIASHYDKAMTLVMIKQWNQAEMELKGALTINRDHVQTLLTLAWLKLEYYRAMPERAGPKSLNDAVQVCRRLLELNPNNIKALGYLGIALRRLERYKEAIVVLEKALRLDPGAYSSWSNLGALHAVVGDLKSAENCLRKGAELAAIAPDRWHAAVWRNLATLEMFLGRDKAWDHVSTALECDVTDVLSWLVRARLGMAKGDPKSLAEALDDAKHADRLSNFKNARAKRVRASAHLAVGEFQYAIDEARLALDLGADPGFAHLVLAAAYAELGLKDAARNELQLAEQHWPDELSITGGYVAQAGTGDLWIESADDWIALASRVMDDTRPLNDN